MLDFERCFDCFLVEPKNVDIFILLAFFYERHQQTAKFLQDYLGIEDLESVLFVLKQPPWSSKEGDRRFWYAKGAVQGFLDKVFSLCPGADAVEAAGGPRTRQGEDRRAVVLVS